MKLDRKSKVELGTKAEVLECLSGMLESAKILPQVRFTVNEWRGSEKTVLKRVLGVDSFKFPLIARSSALNEDGLGKSSAGKYVSVAGISDEVSLREGIERVISSFHSANGADQIFLQPMLEDVLLSGVAFSRDPNTGSQYVVINYDDRSGSTDRVTSGRDNGIKTFYCCKWKKVKLPHGLNRVFDLITELEKLLGNDSLDIEFAIKRQEELYLLQVRPLDTCFKKITDFTEQQKTLEMIRQRLSTLMQPHPYLHGDRAVFGIMPDWNPAEIIGVRPRPLALSLYKEMITDSIWAYQRDNYGYKNLRSFPLLISFSGLPYIDVRVSFNSFIPSTVDASLSEKLANYYIERLVESPSYHDKVEFAIVFSCYTLDLPSRLEILKKYGFSDSELTMFSESLRSLTNGIIHGEHGLWRKDIERIKELEGRRKKILESNLDTVPKIYWLLEDCKRYGTLPFAGLARAGFIAVQMLNSLVNTGILSSDEYEEFMAQLETVSSQMDRDFKHLSKNAFLEKYGHLRPGTYDILSPRYDEAPERYFDWNANNEQAESGKVQFKPSSDQLKRLEAMLVKHRLDHNASGLFEFIKGAIEGREYSKFVFTRSLSDAISMFMEFGAEYGFSREDCSFMDIQIIRQLYATSVDTKEVLRKSMEDGRRLYEVTSQIVLPPLLVDPNDVWSFHLPIDDPNFITMKNASGTVVHVDNINQVRLSGCILMIPRADPGYDWIFARGIAGFVTMYGGVNSHMAIRAGEFGIPAVIGAGERLFMQWSKAKTLELDCANRQVRVLR